jgi:hypothetical protein
MIENTHCRMLLHLTTRRAKHRIREIRPDSVDLTIFAISI